MLAFHFQQINTVNVYILANFFVNFYAIQIKLSPEVKMQLFLQMT